MQNHLFLLLAVLVAGTSVLTSAIVADEIRMLCKGEWPNDFAMRKYCVDRQMSARDWISSNIDDHDQEDHNVHERCITEWPIDYAMRKYCLERQKKGAEDIIQLHSMMKNDQELLIAVAKCREEWTDRFGTDYAMIAYCMERQKDAYDHLKRGE